MRLVSKERRPNQLRSACKNHLFTSVCCVLCCHVKKPPLSFFLFSPHRNIIRQTGPPRRDLLHLLGVNNPNPDLRHRTIRAAKPRKAAPPALLLVYDLRRPLLKLGLYLLELLLDLAVLLPPAPGAVGAQHVPEEGLVELGGGAGRPALAATLLPAQGGGGRALLPLGGLGGGGGPGLVPPAVPVGGLALVYRAAYGVLGDGRLDGGGGGGR